MKADKIVSVLTAIGTGGISVGEEWCKCSCPFAPWATEHKGGVDRNPSFGVKIEPQGKSHFNCFTCHKKGDLQDLRIELMHYQRTHGSANLKVNFPVLSQLLEQENDELYYDQSDAAQKKEEFIAWPDWYLNAFPPVLQVTAATNYLLSRGFTDAEINAFDVRFDQMKQRVVFPFYSTDQELAGLRGRSILDVPRPHFDYKWNGHSNIGITWFNEHKCKTNLPVVVTEGQFDCWSVSRVYPNVVACLSSGASNHKLDRLLYYSSVIFMYDADQPGKLAADKQWAYLKSKGAVVWVVPWTEAQFKAATDPGKLSLSEIRELLHHYVDLA